MLHARASVLTLCALTATQSPLPQTVPGPVDPSFVRVLEAAERGGGPGVSWLEFCTSMSNHRGRADLQLRACDCLAQNGREIAPPDRSLSPTALGPELVTAVLGAMRSHRKNTRLVEACLLEGARQADVVLDMPVLWAFHRGVRVRRPAVV